MPPRQLPCLRGRTAIRDESVTAYGTRSVAHNPLPPWDHSQHRSSGPKKGRPTHAGLRFHPSSQSRKLEGHLITGKSETAATAIPWVAHQRPLKWWQQRRRWRSDLPPPVFCTRERDLKLSVFCFCDYKSHAQNVIYTHVLSH